MRRPPGVRKVIAGPGRQLDRPLGAPATPLEPASRAREVGDGEHVDRPVALEVVGEQDRGRVAEADHRDPDAAVLDREDLLRAEDVDEVAEVGGHVGARRVQVVEAAEGHRTRASVG